MNLTSSILMNGFLIAMGNHGMHHETIIQNIPPIKIANHQHNKYTRLKNELKTYKNLQNNWDGYQGIRPSDELINTVDLVLDILMKKKINEPKIMLSGNGEIALFWGTPYKYIEIDFDEPNKLSFFYEFNDYVYGEDDLYVEDDIPKNLNKVIKDLFNTSTMMLENNSIVYSLDNPKFLTA